MKIYSINADLIQLTSCGQHHCPYGFTNTLNASSENALILVTEGTLYITSNNVDHVISAGEFILLPAFGTHYSTKPSQEKIAYYWIHFTGTLGNENLSINNDSSHIIHLPQVGSFDIFGCAVSIYKMLSDIAINNGELVSIKSANENDLGGCFNSCTSSEHAKRLSKRGLSMFLLQICNRNIDTNYVNCKPIVNRIIDWIDSNYSTAFTVRDIAAEFGYQPKYISTIFKQNIGISITSYVNFVRIKASKILLANYDVSIKDIAFSCGYADERYFIRVFKDREGITPKNFRLNFNRVDPVPSNQDK